MSRRPTLPRHRSLFGLLDQAAKTHFRGSNEFWITGLQKSGQQHIEFTIMMSREQDMFDDRIDAFVPREVRFLSVRIGSQ